MRNPWLTIPPSDYQGHMSLPEIGQAWMQGEAFEAILRAHSSRSAAARGCAGHGAGVRSSRRAGGASGSEWLRHSKAGSPARTVFAC